MKSLLLRSILTAFAIGIAVNSPLSAQNTYRDIPLDTGGWVSGFAQHPSGRLYGYGDIFGLSRSEDFGASWKFLQSRFTEPGVNTFVHSVAVQNSDADRVAFMTASKIWTSTDGGDNWNTRLTDLKKPQLFRGSKPIAYHPTIANQIWLAANRVGLTEGLWRSDDNGASWTGLGGSVFANEHATTIHINPNSPNQIWVGTAAVEGVTTLGGLWCSADSGTTWTKVWNNNGQQSENYGNPLVYSIARSSANVSVIATNDGVWNITATNWNDPSTYIATQRTWNGQAIPNVTLLADGTFWASEIGFQPWAPKVSPDGITWTDRQISQTATYVPEWTSAEKILAANRIGGRDMMIQDVNNPNRWLITGGSAISLSEDNGITWRYQPGGMPGIASYRVNFDRQNPLRAYIATSDRGIFVVDDGGLTGTTVHCSHKAYNELQTYHEVMTSADGQTIVGAGVQQALGETIIVRSTDGGVNWSKINYSGLPPNTEGVTRSVMSLNDPNDFLVLLGWSEEPGAISNPGLYRTINGGASFAKVNGSLFDDVNTGSRYHPENSFLERDGINPNIRYLGLRADNVPAVRGLWRSLDGGTTWNLQSSPFGIHWILGLAVDPTIEGRIWAINDYLRRSDDGGSTWVTVGDFIKMGSIDAYGGRLSVIGRRPGDTFNKVYYSPDNGVTWEEQTSAENRHSWNNSISIDPWRAGQTWLAGPRSIQLINPPAELDPLLTGTITGSAPSAGNPAFSATMAYDGSIATSFVPAANGGFINLDVGAGASAQVTSIRYFPRPGFESRMNGGRFEGSTNGTSWTTLASLSSAPSSGWHTLPITQPTLFRFFRYIHPSGLADTAEIEFHGLQSTSPAAIIQPSNVESIVDSPLNFTLIRSGSPNPTITLAAGALPPGVTLNPKTGLISGTSNVVGTYPVSFTATNSSGTSAPVSFDITILPIPLGPLLTGTVSTSPGSFLSDARKAYDGDTSTFFAPGVSDAFTMLDLGIGNGANVTSIRYFPRPGFTARMIGGRFEGSNDGTTWTTLATITTEPVTGWKALLIDQPGTFRFLRYFNPTNQADVSEIEFGGILSVVPQNLTPLATWKFDGNLLATPTTFNASSVGTINYSAGKIGTQALSLDGTSGNYATTPTVLNPATSDFTVTTWIYLNSKSASASSIVGQADGGGTGRGWLYTYGNDPGTGKVYSRLGGGETSSDTSLAINTWTHIALVKSGTALQYYINGVLDKSVTIPAVESSTGGLTFGANKTGASVLDGKIDDTQVFSIALSPSSIATLYSSATFNALQTFRSNHGLLSDGTQDSQALAGDDVTNLEKYAFNMIGSGTGQVANLSTPNNAVLTPAGTAGLPLIGMESPTQKLQVTFIRRKASGSPAPGINYTVQFSTDLVTWAEDNSAAQSSSSIDGTFERVTVTDSAAFPDKRFVRVQITKP